MTPNSLEFANLVISRYLYDKDSPPANKADVALIRPNNTKGQPISVNTIDYMATVGRFARASEFPVVQWFFNLFNSIPPKLDSNGNITYYTKSDLRSLFGFQNFFLDLQQYQYSDSLYDDLGVRTLIWNSTLFSLTDKVEFWVDVDGQKSIKNFAIVPTQVADRNWPRENYDLESSDLTLPTFGGHP
jgi:hypothetical protein